MCYALSHANSFHFIIQKACVLMHTAQDVCLYALHIEMLYTTRVNNAKFVEILFCFLFWFLVEQQSPYPTLVSHSLQTQPGQQQQQQKYLQRKTHNTHTNEGTERAKKKIYF